MPLNKGLCEFTALLNSNGVEYLIVGAHAVAWYGHPRFTADLDILIRPSASNAACILESLRQFGFGQLRITVDDLCRPEQVLQLGVAPNRIDLLTSISGVDFNDAWSRRETGELENLPVQFIGIDDLIRNKEATGRAKDRGDAEELRKRKAPR